MATRENNREMMFAKIRDWQASGATQKSFCEQHDLKHNAFYYWYKQFRKSESSSEDGFIPVTFSQTSATVFASVVFSSGSSVQLHQVVSPQYLKELLS
jgi:transposase-like protein